MSTGSIPTDDRTTGAARSRRDAPRGAPSLVAELVFRELAEAEAALTESEISERTLLPGSEVHEALAELESRGLCTVRRRGTEHASRRYAAAFPPESEP